MRNVIQRINKLGITDKKEWIRKFVMAVAGERERSGQEVAFELFGSELYRTNLNFPKVSLKADHLVNKRFKKKDEESTKKLKLNDLEMYANRAKYQTNLSRNQHAHKRNVRQPREVKILAPPTYENALAY